MIRKTKTISLQKKKKKVLSLLTKAPRNQRGVLKSLNSWRGVTLYPKIAPPFLLGYFQSKDDIQNLNIEGRLNTYVSRETTNKTSRVVTKQLAKTNMTRDPLAEPSVLHLMIPSSVATYKTYLIRVALGGWMLTKRALRMVNFSIEWAMWPLDRDSTREEAEEMRSVATWQETMKLLKHNWFLQCQKDPNSIVNT